MDLPGFRRPEGGLQPGGRDFGGRSGHGGFRRKGAVALPVRQAEIDETGGAGEDPVDIRVGHLPHHCKVQAVEAKSGHVGVVAGRRHRLTHSFFHMEFVGFCSPGNAGSRSRGERKAKGWVVTGR